MKSAELRGGEANVTAKTKIETTAGATGEGGEAGTTFKTSQESLEEEGGFVNAKG